MKPFRVASFRTTQRSPLQRAARELGHALQTRGPSELANIRRELTEIDEAATDEYTRGFLDALENILSGFSAELKHRRAVADDVASARLRKNATKVITALHAGCHRPSEIAAKTGLKLPTVSAELLDLEREDFVEHVQLSPGDDQRALPRALTVRGLQLAQELTRTTVSRDAEAARSLAPLFVSFINRLDDETYVATDRWMETAVERLGAIDGPFVCQEFIKHAASRRVISVRKSLITLTTPSYSRRFRDLLYDALSPSVHDTLLDRMKELASGADICLRATTALRDPWQMALRRHALRNVYVWCRDDALANQLPAPSGPYHIVWENPEVMTRDREDHDLRVYISNAERHLCYVAPDQTLPQDIERIDLDSYYLHK